MKRALVFAFGVAVILAAIWGGFYILGTIYIEPWARAPSVITIFLFGITGYIIIGYALIEMRSKR